jgi:hypothetical protein
MWPLKKAMEVFFAASNLHVEGPVCRYGVLGGPRHYNLCGHGRADKSVVDVAPPSFGSVAGMTKGDGPETCWGLLLCPCLAGRDGQVKVPNNDVVTWTWLLLQDVAKHLFGLIGLTFPTVNGVQPDLPEGVHTQCDGCMPALSGVCCVVRHLCMCNG